jgi:hypothetical protein
VIQDGGARPALTGYQPECLPLAVRRRRLEPLALVVNPWLRASSGLRHGPGVWSGVESLKLSLLRDSKVRGFRT